MNRVERLLRQAQDWEPEEAMPDNLAQRALRNVAPKRALISRRPVFLMGGGALGTLAAAAVVAVFVLHSQSGTGDAASSGGGEAPAFASQTEKVSNQAQPLLVAEGNPGVSPPLEEGTYPSRQRRPRHKYARHRRGDFDPNHRPILIAARTGNPAASKPTGPISHPVPANAIALDDAPPTLVPVVYADDAPDGSGTRLTPLVLAIPANSGSLSTAINLSTEE